MGKVEEEYRKLYSAADPPGQQIPLDQVQRQNFQVSDKVPKDKEIWRACKRMRQGKVAGPRGLSVNTLHSWEAYEEEDTNWQGVVTLIQHIFRTGEPPSAFQMGTLVLVPKGEPGKYRGIVLLESLYKLTSCLVNKQVCEKVKFHDGVHGFRAKRSCSTAILKVKLVMQLAKRTGRAYHQIFLDLLKAYDTLDQDRLYDIMRGYGLSPRMMKLLIASWTGSGVVP
jgi:hypothetical protein